MRLRWAWPVLLAAVTAAAKPTEIPLQLPSGREFRAELMVAPQDRALGLMFRDSLPEDRALLFVFDNLDFHGIWMKNCKFPIDIVWLDEQGKVVDLREAVPPCTTKDCPSYEPLQRAQYVVEMNARSARREKATIGARLVFTLPR
jgi:uncharacterized membrane protein (UPF0127 family)